MHKIVFVKQKQELVPIKNYILRIKNYLFFLTVIRILVLMIFR